MAKVPVYVVVRLYDHALNNVVGVFSFRELADDYAKEKTIEYFKRRYKTWNYIKEHMSAWYYLNGRMIQESVPFLASFDDYSDEQILQILQMFKSGGFAVTVFETLEVEFFA